MEHQDFSILTNQEIDLMETKPMEQMLQEDLAYYEHEKSLALRSLQAAAEGIIKTKKHMVKLQESEAV